MFADSEALLSKPARLQNSLLRALLGYLPTITSGVQFSSTVKDPWCPRLIPFEFPYNYQKCPNIGTMQE